MRAPFLLIAAVAAMPAPALAEPFGQLRAAYAARDASAAAATYTPDAVVTYRYDGAPEERHVGTEAIASSFRAFFDQIDPASPLDLTFRVTTRQDRRVAGVYRLRVGDAPTYGRFDVTLAPDGRFASDLSTSATAADFDAAPAQTP